MHPSAIMVRLLCASSSRVEPHVLQLQLLFGGTYHVLGGATMRYCVVWHLWVIKNAVRDTLEKSTSVEVCTWHPS